MSAGFEWPGRDARLTERESELLPLLPTGMSSRDLSAHFHVSENTITASTCSKHEACERLAVAERDSRALTIVPPCRAGQPDGVVVPGVVVGAVLGVVVVGGLDVGSRFWVSFSRTGKRVSVA